MLNKFVSYIFFFLFDFHLRERIWFFFLYVEKNGFLYWTMAVKHEVKTWTMFWVEFGLFLMLFWSVPVWTIPATTVKRGKAYIFFRIFLPERLLVITVRLQCKVICEYHCKIYSLSEACISTTTGIYSESSKLATGCFALLKQDSEF